LKMCSEKGIHVIGYFPPYAPILFQAMQNQGEHYAYLSKTAQGLTELFQRYQGSFFDFSDVGAMGGTDEEALDGTHGSEKTFLRIFIVMAKKDSRLATYVDVNYLEQRLREARHQRQIFVEDN
jgi:hypothetical protein